MSRLCVHSFGLSLDGLGLQGLNLNNAVFGFYNGNSAAQFSAQREYYGRSLIMAVKYGFGALPGTR